MTTRPSGSSMETWRAPRAPTRCVRTCGVRLCVLCICVSMSMTLLVGGGSPRWRLGSGGMNNLCALHLSLPVAMRSHQVIDLRAHPPYTIHRARARCCRWEFCTDSTPLPSSSSSVRLASRRPGREGTVGGTAFAVPCPTSRAHLPNPQLLTSLLNLPQQNRRALPVGAQDAHGVGPREHPESHDQGLEGRGLPRRAGPGAQEVRCGAGWSNCFSRIGPGFGARVGGKVLPRLSRSIDR